MYQYKATQDGVLSNPYKRVREGDVVSLPEQIKASWLVPLQEYKPEPEKVTVPHMQRAPVNPAQTTDIPPAPASEEYKRGMAEVQANEARQDALKEVQPNKFVGEAQPVQQPAPEPKAAPEATEQAPKQEGTGNQDVIG